MQKLIVIKKLAEQNTYFDQQFRYVETVTTSVISNHGFFKTLLPTTSISSF